MKHIPLYLFFIAIVVSCRKEEFVTIKTSIDDPQVTKMLLRDVANMSTDTLDASAQTPLVLNIGSEPSILQLLYGRNIEYIYAVPGSHVEIAKSLGKPNFDIKGSHEKEQELLQEFEKQMSISNSKFNMSKIGSGSERVFLQQLELKYENVQSLLTKAKDDGVEGKLVNLLEDRMLVSREETKAFYPIYYKYLTNQDAIVTQSTKPSLPDNILNHPTLFSFSDVRNGVLAVLTIDLNYEDFDDISLYYKEKYRRVSDQINQSIVKEILHFGIINEKINYTGGISGMEDEIAQFVEDAQDPFRKSEIQAQVDRWAHLVKGKTAPDFTAYTREGKEVKLTDLKGKNVYIDVWATWCAPCIKEIPALQQMESKYHDSNVEFVSVSIDKESDREKWLAFLDQKELGGLQIMSQNDWRSEITTNYNITSIPRFIMVNSDGALVNVDAPRPSNVKAFTKMIESVLN